MSDASRSLLRRLGYVLLALSLPGLILGLVFLLVAISGPEDKRHTALTFAVINLGFAGVNVALGLALIAGGRAGRS